MPTTISFLKDPEYGTTVVLFVLSPAGVSFDPKEIGRNLYGKRDFEIEPITIPGLAQRNGFRFSEIPVHWTDFLGLAFSNADHALFFIPGKQKFQEISRESLLQQNPDLYSFSFYRFTCEDYVPEQPEEEQTYTASRVEARPATTETNASTSTGGSATWRDAGNRDAENRDAEKQDAGKQDAGKQDAGKQDAGTKIPGEKLREAQETVHSLIDAGWSTNAISRVTGISPITLGNIRKEKQSSVSDRVHDTLVQLKADFASGKVGNPSRGKRGPAAASGTARVKSTSDTPRSATAESGPKSSGTVTGDTGRTTRDVPAGYPGRKTDDVPAEDTGPPRYIAVDANKLESLLNRLITTFADAIDDLRDLDGTLQEQDQDQ